MNCLHLCKIDLYQKCHTFLTDVTTFLRMKFEKKIKELADIFPSNFVNSLLLLVSNLVKKFMCLTENMILKIMHYVYRALQSLINT